MKTGWGG